MHHQDTERLRSRKAEIDERLDPEWQPETQCPVIGGANLAYEMSGRIDAIPCGGIGAIHEMVRALGLQADIDEYVHLFKRHFPYHESDHVLNLAYNVMCGGKTLDDIDLLRENPAYLDAIGCYRVPDPTTAGDFLRRFDEDDVHLLMEAINATRLKAWRHLPRSEKKLALIDADGTMAPTTGECKEGMDISYKGSWGYHPLIVTLANTQEVLYTKNRPGNRPSHDDAASYLNAAVELAKLGGFERVRLRGDTDFALTKNFDDWTREGTEFVFGIDAHKTFKARAGEVPDSAWKPLIRQESRKRKGASRQRPENVKERIIVERGYKSLALESEHIAEIAYQPGACNRSYRMVIVRKTIKVTEGALRLEDEIRYFFYVSNVKKSRISSKDIVFQANARCNQENTIEQLKNGVQALRMPSDSLTSNWAYLVIASLAWNLKAWLSMCLPARHKKQAQQIRKMEYRRFKNSVMMIPCQVVRRARGVLLRILVYSDWAGVLIDGQERFKRWRLT